MVARYRYNDDAEDMIESRPTDWVQGEYVRYEDYKRALDALRAFNDAYSFISESCPQPLTHAVRKARRIIAENSL